VEQHGVEQVLGKVLLQTAKLQQMLLHGRFAVATRAVRFSVATRAVGAYAAATSRCRTNTTLSKDQKEWKWRWKEEEGFEAGGGRGSKGTAGISKTSASSAFMTIKTR
jgi:hypothetical protein